MIELPRNEEFQGPWLKKFSNALYFAFSTLTFSHGQSIKSPFSKIVVVIWCFVVLILVQSYTASLSAMLTAKRLRPFVKDLDQLQRSGDFVGYQDGSFVRAFLVNHNFSESRLRNYTTKDEYAAALRLGSKDGGVSALVDEIPYLTSFLSHGGNKNDFRMLGSTHKTPGFGFVLPLGSPLVHNLSIAILNLAGSSEGAQIEGTWFGTSSLPIGDGTLLDTDSGPLTLQSFSGLFVITASISTLMLVISTVYHKCIRRRKTNVQIHNSNGLNEHPNLLQNGTSQHSLHEIGNDSQVIHVSSENSGEGEHRPVQLNGMHTGPVPARHVQIEMSNV